MRKRQPILTCCAAPNLLDDKATGNASLLLSTQRTFLKSSWKRRLGTWSLFQNRFQYIGYSGHNTPFGLSALSNPSHIFNVMQTHAESCRLMLKNSFKIVTSKGFYSKIPCELCLDRFVCWVMGVASRNGNLPHHRPRPTNHQPTNNKVLKQTKRPTRPPCDCDV